MLPVPRIQIINDLKYDQLEHGATECKGDGEYELDQQVMDLIVAEQLLHKEYPATNKEDYLEKWFSDILVTESFRFYYMYRVFC